MKKQALSNSVSFTKFHSKELNRALKTLPAKAFVAFTTMNHLITRYNSKNTWRNLSVADIQNALPFSTSHTTLKKCLDLLREESFMKSFQDLETKHNVYSMIHRHAAKGGYSKIDDFVLTNIFKIIADPEAIKLYILIYLGNTTFTKEGEEFIKF